MSRGGAAGGAGCLGKAEENRPPCTGTLPSLPQRQKSAFAAATYPKAEPAPVASSAPPASGLYSSPVVSARAGPHFCARRRAGCPREDGLVKPVRVEVQPGPRQPCAPGQGLPVGEGDTGKPEDLPRVRGGGTPWARRGLPLSASPPCLSGGWVAGGTEGSGSQGGSGWGRGPRAHKQPCGPPSGPALSLLGRLGGRLLPAPCSVTEAPGAPRTDQLVPGVRCHRGGIPASRATAWEEPGTRGSPWVTAALARVSPDLVGAAG